MYLMTGIRSMLVVSVLVLLLSLAFIILKADSVPCYPAVFAFGDSLTDTGNALNSINVIGFFASYNAPPYGETYFGHPAHRYSDGRLIIDHLALSMGLPFLNPVLNFKTLWPNFSQGINYAVAGALALDAQYYISKRLLALTPVSLDVQLNWHLNIKSTINSSTPASLNLPKPRDYSKALYFLEVGGNDYGVHIVNKRFPASRIHSEVLPLVIQKITAAVEVLLLNNLIASNINVLCVCPPFGSQLLYNNDARHFFILNVTPQGCTPLYHSFRNGSRNDEKGCIQDLDDLDRAHANKLGAAIGELRDKYPDASIIYGDLYSAYETIVRNPSTYGFQNTLDTCCGAGPGFPYEFSYRKLCGRKTSYVCSDPSSYVIWDGVHLTDNAARQIVNQFIAGEFVDPANSLACASPISS